MKLGLLISGNLGQIVLLHLLKSPHEIVFVFTDKKSDVVIETCRKERIDIFLGNPRNNMCSDFIADKSIDILISVNYIFIIEKQLLQLPSLLAFNIHGSLLPKYRGRTPHVWAIINNESETGITAHVIDENCDTGDIIHQVKVSIENNDTGASLLSKFNELYIPIVDKVIDMVLSNDILNRTPQDNRLASFFGKRTPDDGLINWNWQKERIRNWIRAQAYPYPGAFTLVNGKRVIIDEIKYSDRGFNFDMPNGLVLENEPLIVKTPNGSVEITKIRDGKKYCIEGTKFYSCYEIK
jgi:methionyl-tRNA formyltransferase